MPRLDDAASDVLDALTARYGRARPSAWDLDPFEALAATAFDLALDAPKRSAAVEALREAGLLDPSALAESDPSEAAEVLRSAGVKSPEKALLTLRRLAAWVVEAHGGDADSLAGEDGPATAGLREELTAIKGIGQSAADALLLFALRRPVYPVDRATYRVFVRHGWVDPSADYEEARDRVEGLAPDDPSTLAHLSTAFERVGREYCRASVAKCEKCPLRPFLPDGGPVDPRD